MKGIILAGGTGTRLFPLTIAVSKQLLPIYDKPMIYYPMATLMDAMIDDVLIISQEINLTAFHKLFGDGSRFGINVEYLPQNEPRGIAEAFIIGREFIAQNPVTLILGDNIFHSPNLSDDLISNMTRVEKSPEGLGVVYAYTVKDPERYGVVQFDNFGRAMNIEEKPEKPKTNFAITGLYTYDKGVVDRALNLKPSDRGELEITDINKSYLADDKLIVRKLPTASAWLDTGTHESMDEASQYVKAIEHRQGQKIGCIEEIAYRNGWIDENQLFREAHRYRNTEYGNYLRRLIVP